MYESILEEGKFFWPRTQLRCNIRDSSNQSCKIIVQFYLRTTKPQRLKILITGHTGYIGRSLTTYLTGICGHTVIGVSRKGPSTPNQVVESIIRESRKPAVDSVTPDDVKPAVDSMTLHDGKPAFDSLALDGVNPAVPSITWDELESTRDIDCIIHLAGMAKEEHSRSHEQDYFRVNTELTREIYDFFLRSAAHSFIYFSSIKAAAEVSDIPLTEEENPHPVSEYGRSKQQAEAYILSHMPGDQRRKEDPNLSKLPGNQRHIYILRPCMIHGPGRHGNLKALFNYIRKGFPWPFFNLDNHRSYLSMENLNYIIGEFLNPKPDIPSLHHVFPSHCHENSSLVTCHLSLVTCHSSLVTCHSSLVTCHSSLITPPSGIYHLCDDDPLSSTRIIAMMGEVLGRKPAALRLPAWLIHFAAITGTTLHLPFNRMTVKKMTGNLIVSNSRIKNALNISALPVTAEQGMYKTLESFKDEST